MPDYPFTRDQLVPPGLPKGSDVVADGRCLGRKITVGRTLFVETNGVKSEAEYKRKMREAGRIMFHSQYGLSNWADSAAGLKHIHARVTERNGRIDRFGICLDRAMGLPPEMRDSVPRETGLKLRSRSEWLEIGRVVPIQPHMGDHMVGSPASVTNVTNALDAGVTSIGNLSQYFLFEYPSWKDQTSRAIETLKALAIMAEHKDHGAIQSSNLDDGPGSMFNDRASVAGWAMIEHYIAEELVGTALTHCFGNLVTDPVLRQATLLVVDAIHGGETAGSMVIGNTMFTMDDDRNMAVLSGYLTVDMAAQMLHPTGHAMYVTPVSEHARIPSPEEIIQAEVMANQLEREVRRALPLFDMRKSEALARTLLERGIEFKKNVLTGLADMGIDTRDPLEMLMSLKKLGGKRLEEMFGVGEPDASLPGGRRPVVPSDMFSHTVEAGDHIRSQVDAQGLAGSLRGRRIVLAGTDVHAFGATMVKLALEKAGATVTDLGTSVDSDDAVDAVTGDIDGLCLSTYNGMCAVYGQAVMDRLKERKMNVPVFMGGRLNQDVGDGLPRDATDDLRKIGIAPLEGPLELIQALCRVREIAEVGVSTRR